MAAPFFSILIPVYNAEKYLNPCLESIMNQSFEDFEVVLVNDGSTDQSAEICDTWQRRWSRRIRVIHQENRGVVHARETLFQAALGNYIVSVDSDDTLHPEALQVLKEIIDRHAADVVIYCASEEPDYSISMRDYSFRENQVYSLDTSPELKQLMGATDMIPNLWNKAFRRELLDGISIPADITEGEDLLYSILVMEKAERILFSHRILYFYRQHATGITRSYNPVLYRSMRKVCQMQRAIAEKWDPSGELARDCDTDSLDRYYRILTRICYAACPPEERTRGLLEIVTDEEFLRVYPQKKDLPSLKKKIVLILAKNRCFAPFFLYTALRNGFRK